MVTGLLSNSAWSLLGLDRSAVEFGVYPIYLHDAPSSDNNFGDARIGPLVRILRYGVCFAMKSMKLESGLQLNYPTIPHALSHVGINIYRRS